MIDIHTHILYGVDDGSDSYETSKYLLDQAVKNNIDTIILTPHQNEELKRSDKLINKFTKFKAEFSEFNINFYLGSEIYYYPNMIKDLKNNELLTINNTKYVLVEFSTSLKTDIAEVAYDLKVSGYIPIIAHIERYQYLNYNDYIDIKNSGALIQVNSKSFNQKQYKKSLKYLLKNDLIDFISSDCHNQYRDIDYETSMKIILKKYKDRFNKYFNNFIFN